MLKLFKIFIRRGSVALYCTYCTYARTVLTYRIDLSYTYCTYIPYSFSPSRILNPDTVYVDASQLQATSFTFLANVVSFAFSSLLTYLVTNTSSFSALQPLARLSPQYPFNPNIVIRQFFHSHKKYRCIFFFIKSNSGVKKIRFLINLRITKYPLH